MSAAGHDTTASATAPHSAAEPDVSLAAPVAPHDDLTFEQLADRYNFRSVSHNGRVLARLIMKECRQRTAPRRVLDIGCGGGIARSVELQWSIRPLVEAYWGLEPDTAMQPTPGLFDRWVPALMEEAPLPAAWFDVVYSCMVMEHVSDPEGFLQAVWRCLKPGGVYLFMTPNARHYFTRAARLLHALKLDELVLRCVKRGAEQEYHYPVHYRMNSERRIDAAAGRAGFLRPEYLYLEAVGPRGYFPGPTRVIFDAMAAKRRLIRNRRALVALVARLRRPPDQDV